MNKKLKILSCAALIVFIGGISSLFFKAPNFYNTLNLPPFAPPTLTFPIAWTFLYAFLGVYLYSIIEQRDYKLLNVYIIQLVVNLSWSFVFFNYQLFILAFIMILIMIGLTIILIIKKYKYYQLIIIYLLWLIFAGALNLSIIILN